jgi:hypothetical protein
MGAVDELGGVLSHQRQVFVVLSANVGGVVHVAAGQGDDRPGHGRGEQHRLPVRGHRIDDLLHIGQEPEIEHLIGLVEDDGADTVESEDLAPIEVEEATGGADDDVDACLETADLGIEVHAAVDRHDVDITLHRGSDEIGCDLLGQLTGGHDDEGLRQTRLLGVARAVGSRLRVGGHRRVLRLADDSLEQRDAEAEGLAGPGLRLTDDVGARESHRQRQCLNREGMGDARCGQRGHDRSGDSQVREIRFCLRHIPNSF